MIWGQNQLSGGFKANPHSNQGIKVTQNRKPGQVSGHSKPKAPLKHMKLRTRSLKVEYHIQQKFRRSAMWQTNKLSEGLKPHQR